LRIGLLQYWLALIQFHTEALFCSCKDLVQLDSIDMGTLHFFPLIVEVGGLIQT
jgi:hypothetical protein